MPATDRPNPTVEAGRDRRGRILLLLGAAALAVAVLAVYRESPLPQQQQETKAPPPDLAAKAVAAAQEAVAASVRAPGEATFRAVQTWRQAIPRTVAVCGQVNPKGSPHRAVRAVRRGDRIR
ncbi:MAG: hypothetical protein ACJ8AI_04305, partial [Rhodopila sp.]